MATYNTILVQHFTPIRKEKKAAAAITPGHLLERTSADKFQVHSTAGGNAQMIFACEDELQGKDIDTAYAADAVVLANVCRAGDEVFALLKDGENVSIGDYLESAGDGTLQEFTQSSDSFDERIVAVALEAVDLSGSSAADPSARILVEIV